MLDQCQPIVAEEHDAVGKDSGRAENAALDQFVGVGLELLLVLGQRDFLEILGFVEPGLAHDIAQDFVFADVAIVAPVSLEHAARIRPILLCSCETKAPRMALTELTGKTTSADGSVILSLYRCAQS